MHGSTTLRSAIAALGVAALVWACNGEDRTTAILGLEGDIDTGRELYVDTPNRACASCHAVPAQGIQSDNGGPPLTAVDTDARTTIASIVEGTVGAHDAQDYTNVLTDQQIADIAAWVEAVGDQ